MSEKSKGDTSPLSSLSGNVAGTAGVASSSSLRIVKNPLLSASVTGLTFDDFSQKAFILPAAPPIIRPNDDNKDQQAQGVQPTLGSVTVGKKPDIDLSSFSEISLSQPVDTEQLQGGETLNQKPAQISDDSLIPQSSFTQSVASSVFSTFTRVLKDYSPTPRDPQPGLYNTRPEEPTFVDQKLQEPLPAYEPPTEPPRLYTPSEATFPNPGPPPIQTSGTSNTYRLSAKKKTYAQIPGLSSHPQQLQQFETVGLFQPPQTQPQIDNQIYKQESQQHSNFFVPPVPQEELKTGSNAGIFSFTTLVPPVLQNISGFVSASLGRPSGRSDNNQTVPLSTLQDQNYPSQISDYSYRTQGANNQLEPNVGPVLFSNPALNQINIAAPSVPPPFPIEFFIPNNQPASKEAILAEKQTPQNYAIERAQTDYSSFNASNPPISTVPEQKEAQATPTPLLFTPGVNVPQPNTSCFFSPIVTDSSKQLQSQISHPIIPPQDNLLGLSQSFNPTDFGIASAVTPALPPPPPVRAIGVGPPPKLSGSSQFRLQKGTRHYKSPLQTEPQLSPIFSPSTFETNYTRASESSQSPLNSASQSFEVTEPTTTQYSSNNYFVPTPQNWQQPTQNQAAFDSTLLNHPPVEKHLAKILQPLADQQLHQKAPNRTAFIAPESIKTAETLPILRDEKQIISEPPKREDLVTSVWRADSVEFPVGGDNLNLFTPKRESEIGEVESNFTKKEIHEHTDTNCQTLDHSVSPPGLPQALENSAALTEPLLLPSDAVQTINLIQSIPDFYSFGSKVDQQPLAVGPSTDREGNFKEIQASSPIFPIPTAEEILNSNLQDNSFIFQPIQSTENNNTEPQSETTLPYIFNYFSAQAYHPVSVFAASNNISTAPANTSSVASSQGEQNSIQLQPLSVPDPLSFFDSFHQKLPAAQPQTQSKVPQQKDDLNSSKIQDFFNNPPQTLNQSACDFNYNLVGRGVSQAERQHEFLNNSTHRAVSPSSNLVEPPSSACSEFSTEVQSVNASVNHEEIFNLKKFKEEIDQSDNEDMTTLLGSSNTTDATYKPVTFHWFYKKPCDSKFAWTPFSYHDSSQIDEKFLTEDGSSPIAVEGGRYEVNISNRLRYPIYWEGKSTEVRRCSWFYKAADSRYVPYEEPEAQVLEEEYRQSCNTGQWQKEIVLTSGEKVKLYNATTLVHYLQPQTSSDSWGNKPQTTTRSRTARRDIEEFDIEAGEPSKVDHLLFMVHGIGSACDLKFRPVDEVVDEFRSIATQLIQAHYKNSCDNNLIGRIEVLPVSWHSELHSEESGIDQKLKAITLESIPKLRNFANDTLLDVLFYTSPIFCQSIMDTVAGTMNKVYARYCQRNPDFKGGVSLAGHSLGSLILFDLLCHQKGVKDADFQNSENPDQVIRPLDLCPSSSNNSITTETKISYTMGPAGTGQPFINYPQLIFAPRKFFALGSPIGMFVTIRGIDALGLEFKLPTCQGFYNIFHPYDPVAYRIEALVNQDLASLRPVLIPHHKGRKRMHLELKETMTRVGADLKQRVLDKFKATLDVVCQIASTKGKADTKEIEMEVDKVLDMQLKADGESPRSRQDSVSTQSDIDTGETDLALGNLNETKRIDYVLQEAPLEFFNEYLFALTSHVCYWESSDTILFIVKEIYSSFNIETDSQVPQQSMTIERPSSRSSRDSPSISSASSSFFK